MAEKPVLDLVPFGCSRRKVTDFQHHTGFVRQPLQFDLEQSHTRSVGTATIGQIIN
jgi:hypothetical protein